MSDEMPEQLNPGQPEAAAQPSSLAPVEVQVTQPQAWVPPRPRVWTAFTIFLLAVLANAIGGAVYLYNAGAFDRNGSIRDDVFLRSDVMTGLMFWSMVAVAFVAALGTLVSPVSWRERLRLKRPSMSLGQIAAAAVGATSIGLMYSMCDALELLPRSTTLSAMSVSLSKASGENLLIAVLVIGLMPGVAEELLFRGYIQTRLSQRWGVPFSVLVTSLLFAVYHMDFSQGVLALLAGLFLGAVAERAKSIIPAMIAHAANNSFGVLSGTVEVGPASPAVYWAILMGTVVIVVLCVGYIWSGRGGLPAETKAAEITNDLLVTREGGSEGIIRPDQ